MSVCGIAFLLIQNNCMTVMRIINRVSDFKA